MRQPRNIKVIKAEIRDTSERLLVLMREHHAAGGDPEWNLDSEHNQDGLRISYRGRRPLLVRQGGR